MSSFGYSGTIAHVVLRHTAGIKSPVAMPPLAYRRRAFMWREPTHPFAQRRLPASGGAEMHRSPAVGALHALVADHVLQTRVIFPGAGYLELARACITASVPMHPALRGVMFVQPLDVGTIGLQVESAVGDGRFEVRSGMADNAASLIEMTVHCSGSYAPRADGASTRWAEYALVRSRRCERAADVVALYDGFDAVGLQYGPGYRTLVQAWFNVASSSARLRSRSALEGTQVHPADLDDALCVSSLASGVDDGKTRLPFAVDEAVLEGASGKLWAVSRRATADDRSAHAEHCSCAHAGCGARECGGGGGEAELVGIADAA